MKFEREFFYDEVQDGFYIPGIMKRAWGAELTILSELDRICNQYDIPYYADGGTLLGAVRNGQFIPWDDDIDIMMLRKDYDKFKEVLKDELAKELSLYTLETQDNHYSFFTTLSTHDVDVHSGLLRKYREYPFIASVDIFVIDELSKKPEEEERRKRVLMGFLAILNRLKKNPEKDDTFHEELKKLENLISVHFDRDLPLERQLYREIEKELIQYNGKGGERFACIPWYILHEDCSYPKTAFDKRKESLSILHLFLSRKTMMQYFVQNTEIIIERLEQAERITIPILRNLILCFKKSLKTDGCRSIPFQRKTYEDRRFKTLETWPCLQ